MNELTVTDLHLRYGTGHGPEPMLLVGLQLADGQRFWADVVERSGQTRSEAFLSAARTRLLAYLKGKELSGLVAHEKSRASNPLFDLEVPIMVEQEVEVTVGDGEVRSEGKRKAFLSALGQAQPRSEIVQVETSVNMPETITRAVQTMLMQAALANNLSHLPERSTLSAPKLITPIDLATDPSLFATADILLLSIPQQVDPTRFGANGEALQKHIGEVSQWIIAQADAIGRTDLPKLMVQLNGLYGALFHNRMGKILGAFYGINYASKAVQLLLVDPIIPADFETGFNQYSDLRKMVKSRGIKVELILGEGLTTLEALNQWLETGFFNRLLLSSSQFDSPYHLIEALERCKSHSIETILEIDSPSSYESVLFWNKVAYAFDINDLIPPPSRHSFAESQNFLLKKNL